jgi:hypothetical protein
MEVESDSFVLSVFPWHLITNALFDGFSRYMLRMKSDVS